MTRRCTVVTAALLSILFSNGCDIVTRPSVGELGVVEYAFNRGVLGCMFGCNAEAPVAERSRVDVLVLGTDELPELAISSDAPEVATFLYDPEEESLVVGLAGEPGVVRIVLQDATSGELIDRLPLRVRPVSRLELRSPEYDETLTIMVGGEVIIGTDLLDADEENLVGVGGVDYSLAGGIDESQVTLGTALADAIVSVLVGTIQESLDVTASAVGTGGIAITAPSGASLEVPVGIVDADAITRVAILVPEEPPVLGETYGVTAAAWSGAEIVHSPSCDWSISPVGGPIWIDFAERDTLAVYADAPGSAEVTCTIGAAAASTQITYE